MINSTDLREIYNVVAKENNCAKFGSSVIAKKTLEKIKRSFDVGETLERIYFLLKGVCYQRRCYGRGVFYSWPYWTDGPLKNLNLGDPWPAQCWPKDILAFEILCKYVDNEISL